MEVFLGLVFLLALGSGTAECGRYMSERRNEMWEPEYLRRRLNRRLTISAILMVEVVLSLISFTGVLLSAQAIGMLCGLIWMFSLLRADMKDTREMAKEMEQRLQKEILKSSLFTIVR